jgi:NitT/TauT family transport system substrate-binding protein
MLRGCLLVVLLLGACSPKGGGQQPEPVELKVVLAPYLAYAPLFIADEEGYFVEQGLQIEFIRLARSAEAIPSLVSGEVDVLPTAVSVALLSAVARDQDIRLVAGLNYDASAGCTVNALLARPELLDSGELDSPAQLGGRRVSMRTAGINEYLLETMLDTTGVTLGEIEVVDVPAAAEAEALEKGTIDVAFASEPWVTRNLQTGHADIWTPLKQVIPDFQAAIIVYGPTLLEENPDVGRRFVVAYIKALQQYREGKTARNIEILAEYTELDRELLTEACWPTFPDDGRINVQSVLDFQAWAVKKGYLDSPVTEEQFWDPSFVEYASEVLGASSQ